MNILTCDGYFKYKSGKFESTKITKKWCLKNSPDNVCNILRYQNEVLMQNMYYMEEFLKNGKGLDVHQNYTEEQWEAYQNGMLDMAKATAKSAPKLAPKLRNPAEMLDIGGSHGLYCVEMCIKYPTLKATILDLPQAVDKARPILEKYSMGDRINYMIGNALTDDFGENKYDIILISSLMHHFTSEQNILVSKKAAKALKSGGFFIIQDWLRPEPSSKMEMVGTIMDLVFNITSLSGTRGVDEFKNFQHEAGFIHHQVKTFMEIPGFVQVCAKKQ